MNPLPFCSPLLQLLLSLLALKELPHLRQYCESKALHYRLGQSICFGFRTGLIGGHPSFPFLLSQSVRGGKRSPPFFTPLQLRKIIISNLHQIF